MMAQRNAADESSVKDAAWQAKRAAERDIADLRAVLSTREGRRFIWKLIGDCGVFRSSMTGNSQTFFLEGTRSVGLQLLSRITQDAQDLYLKMQQEAFADATPVR